MKFKIDENLPVEVTNLLTEHGHDAMTVFQENLDGALIAGNVDLVLKI